MRKVLVKVFGDCFKQKTAHNSVFSSFSAWGDPSFAEVKNSSSFKKQAPIFLEQKTWDFSTILSKLGSPKPGGKSLNLTKKGFYRTHLGCSFDHENIKEGTCANKCLYTWYFKIQESVDWRNVILYIVSFSSNEPFKFRKISKGFSFSGAFSEVDDWATAAGDRRGWLWSGVGNFPIQKSENPLLVTCVTCRCLSLVWTASSKLWLMASYKWTHLLFSKCLNELTLSHEEKLLAQVFDGLGGSQFCRSMGEVDSVSTICAYSKQQELEQWIHAKFWNRGVKMKPTMSML